MPREYIKGDNGVDITSERQDRIDEILKNVELSVDQRGNAPLLPAEFWPNNPDVLDRLYVRVYPTQNQSYVLISSEAIPVNAYGRIRLTLRDGSSEISSSGCIIECRQSTRKEDTGKQRFISVFITQ